MTVNPEPQTQTQAPPTATPDGPTPTPPPAPEIVPCRCNVCGGSFTVEIMAGMSSEYAEILRRFAPKVCAACGDAESERIRRECAERDARLVAERRTAEWEAICPPLYRNPDPSRFDPKAAAAVNAWDFGSRGLCLVGLSRAGKTTLMLHKLHGLHMAGLTVAFVGAVQFGHGVARASGDSQSSLDAYIRALIRVDVLAIDDVGKERATERVQSELYNVLEERTNSLKPVFVTTQLTDAEFGNKFAPDLASAILGRIKDFCLAVPVVKQPLRK